MVRSKNEVEKDAPAPGLQHRGHGPAAPAAVRSLRPSRAEVAAGELISMAAGALPGDHLGSKEALRLRCGVSVGTFNEAVRIAQSRQVVTVRPGPGGGVFASTPSPMVRLGNSVLALDAEETTVAEAIRIRDALEPLIVDDALWYASPADLAGLPPTLAEMSDAVDRNDAVAFVHANWALHSGIAALSPHIMLRSLYAHLLEHIESHTLAVLPGEGHLALVLQERYELHASLLEAIKRRDRPRAQELVALHRNSEPPVGADLALGDAGTNFTGDDIPA